MAVNILNPLRAVFVGCAASGEFNYYIEIEMYYVCPVWQTDPELIVYECHEPPPTAVIGEAMFLPVRLLLPSGWFRILRNLWC